MSDDKRYMLVFITFVFFVSGWCFGCLTGGIVMERKYRRQSIEHNYAEYDAVTGEWGWLEHEIVKADTSKN